MKTIPNPSCYGCLGTGKIVGFGMTGNECMCVVRCYECEEPIAWEHDDECKPTLCETCKDKRLLTMNTAF